MWAGKRRFSTSESNRKANRSDQSSPAGLVCNAQRRSRCRPRDRSPAAFPEIQPQARYAARPPRKADLPRNSPTRPPRLNNPQPFVAGSPLSLLPFPSYVALGQRAIGVENHFDGLAQVFAGLLQRVALGVCAGQFFDEGDLALRHLNIGSSEFHLSFES